MLLRRPLRVHVGHFVAAIICLAVLLSISTSIASANARFTWKPELNVASGTQATAKAETADTGSFGQTAVGTSVNGGFAANFKRASAYPLTVAGTINELRVYLQPTTTSGTQTLKGVIYANSAGKPGALLGVTTPLTFSSTGTAGWYDLPLTQPLSATAGTYWLGIISGGTSGVSGFRWTSASGSRAINANTYTSGPSSSFGTYSTDGEQMSLYATYTPAASVPQNTSVPVISGQGQQGTLSTSTSGTWTSTPTSYAYQWQRCQTTCTDIASATTHTYSIATGDIGYKLRASVAATNASGTATPVMSVQTAVVTAAAASSYQWLGTFNAGGGPCINLAAGTYSYASYVGQHVHCVTDPIGGTGRTVAEYDVTNTDYPYSGDTNPRADVESPRIMQTPTAAAPAHDYYVATSMYLPSSTPVPSYTCDHCGAMLWEIFAPPFGNPTMDLSFTSTAADPTHDHLRFAGDVDGTLPHAFWYSGAAVTGGWHSVIAHVNLAATDAGYIQLWLDGIRQTFTGCTIGSTNHCSTDGVLSNDTFQYKTVVASSNGGASNFLDLNSYRPPCSTAGESGFCGTLTTYQGVPAIGPTYASVANTQSSPTGP